MKKIFAILPRIAIVLAILPLLGINLAVAYIMFAPDAWPKPFYLTYQFPAQTAAEEAAAAENTEHTSDEPVAHAAAPEEGSESSSTGEETAPVVPLEIRAGQGLMVDTGTKIVNLVDPTGRRYLRAGIVLEFAPTDLRYYTMVAEEKTLFVEEFNTEITALLPIMNDVIITALSTQTFETVYTADGKELLRSQIMDTINAKFPEQRVIFVYFTEFVVQ
jgi:flagellar basal body-associated protein FliL